MYGDFDKYINYVPVVLIALTLTLVITPAVMKIARMIDAVSRPQKLRDKNERGYQTHIHENIVPKLGFIPVVLSIFIFVPIFLTLNVQISAIILALGLMTIFGILDDKYNLSGIMQFGLLSLCALLVIFAGINITEANNPFTNSFLNFDRGRMMIQIWDEIISFNLLSVVVSFIWFMIVINAINWNDGVDGVLNGTVSIAALIILLVSIREGNMTTAVFSALLLGANIGLLRYNFYPARIFNSYGGQISGFLIAALSIMSNVKLSIAVLIILFPLFDFAWVLLGRIRRLKPKSPIQLFSILNVSDTTHLHHRLMKMGYGKRRIAIIEYSCAFAAGLAAILLSGLELTFVILSSVFIVLLIFIFLDKMVKIRKQHA